MKIHSIKLEGFMLYRKLYKVFGDKDVIGIVAEYADNKERSNRGGKTTIIEAIRYALFGSSRAEREVDLIHHGMEEMSVKLVLDDDGRKHTIIRGRTKSNIPIFEVDRIQKSGEAQERICEIIGFSERELDLTCFFKQQEINQFMEMSPRDKQKHLMQWLKNDHWMRLERAVLDDMKEEQRTVIELESRRKAILEQIQDRRPLIMEIKDTKKHLQLAIAKREQVEKKLSQLSQSQMSKAQLAKLEDEIRSYQQLISELDDRADRVRGCEKSLKREVSFQQEIKQTLSKLPAYNSKLEQGVLRDMETRRTALQSLQEQVRTAKSDFTGMCPVLNQACDRISFDAKKVKQWEQAIKDISLELKEKEGLFYQLALARKHQDALQQSIVKSDRYRSSVETLNDLNLQIDRSGAALKQKLDELKQGRLNNDQENISTLKKHIKDLNKTIENFNSRIAVLRDRKSKSEELKTEIEKLEDYLTAHRVRISHLRYCAFMFGKGGIPSQEIENAFDEIEDETNFVLQKFGTNLVTQFNPDRELKAFEEACLACGEVFAKGKHSRDCSACGTPRQRKRKDELSIKVLENGQETSFAQESGGGKTLVSFANRLALTRLVQRKTGSKFNVLFLDEPDSALDVVNKAAFMDLISKTLIRHFGFEQIFWITHAKEIQESIPYVLKVMRHRKHSTAAWL